MNKNGIVKMKRELEAWRQDYKQMAEIMTDYRKRKFGSHAIDAVVTLINDIEELKEQLKRKNKRTNAHA